MTLQFDNQPIHHHFERDGVFFRGTTADDRLVPCLVSREALTDRAQSRDGSPDKLIALFQRFKSDILNIATRKFATHDVDADGWIIVKSRDLN